MGALVHYKHGMEYFSVHAVFIMYKRRVYPSVRIDRLLECLFDLFDIVQLFPREKFYFFLYRWPII